MEQKEEHILTFIHFLQEWQDNSMRKRKILYILINSKWIVNSSATSYETPKIVFHPSLGRHKTQCLGKAEFH